MVTNNIVPASVRELLDTIKQGIIAPVYLIHGEEESQLNEFLGWVLDEILPKEYRDGNLLQTALDKDAFRDHRDFLDTMPFLAPRRVVVFEDCPLIQRSKKLSKDLEHAMGELKQLIEQKNPTCVIIFLFWVDDEKKRWIDKRSSFFKFIQKHGQVIETDTGFKLGTLMHAVASRKLDEAILIFQNLSETTPKSKINKLCETIAKRLRESLKIVITNGEMPKQWYFDADQKEAIQQFQVNFQQSQLLVAYDRLLDVEDWIRPRKSTELVSENPLDVVQEWITNLVH